MMDIKTGKAISGKKSLSQSIDLILLTQKGERLFNRNFGSNILTYIGNPTNAISIEVGGEVISVLQDNDIRITVDRVNVLNDKNDASCLCMEVYYNGNEVENVKIR